MTEKFVKKNATATTTRAAATTRAASAVRRIDGNGAAWREAGSNGPAAGSRGIALWRQIAEDIEADIQTGHFIEGARLPTEAALAERFGVNRHTLRRAIGELTDKGLIEATAGRGTFVRASRLAYPIGETTRFTEAVAGSGREPGGRLLANARIVAPPAICKLLNLGQGSEVIELDHLRAASQVPICYATTWFPADRFADIAHAYARHGSVTKSLAEFGVKRYRRKRTQISARLANTQERGLLDLDRGAIVLVIESINVDTKGQPVQASHTRFAADRVELVVEN